MNFIDFLQKLELNYLNISITMSNNYQRCKR